jgi:putative hydrolase of the HAD superfamily
MKAKIKAIFFDIDNTLYDSTLQVELARRNAVKAMIEAGLDLEEDNALEELKKIVEEYGSNYNQHFNRLLERFNYKENPRIIAAGVVAYHNTKLAYLNPFPDTIPTLLTLRDVGYKLGVITDGKAIKQWEKIIRLGIQHFFHSVTVSETVGEEKPSPKIFQRAVEELNCKVNESVMVGDRLDKDILGANKAGMVSVQIVRGKYKNEKPKNPEEEPDYLISNLGEILNIIILKEKKREKRDE